MHKLRQLWSREPSPVANRNVVPLKPDTVSREDVAQTTVIDVGRHNKDFQDSLSSSTTQLEAKVGGRPSAPPMLRKGSLRTHLDTQSAPCSHHRTPSASTSSLSVCKRSCSSQTLRLYQKGERLATKSETSIEKQNGMESVASRSNLTTARPRVDTVWSSDDAFLPRAKPPPPLITKHNRNRSATVSLPSPTTHQRPSTSHEAGSCSHRKVLKRPQRDTPKNTPELHPPRPSTARSYSMEETSPRPRAAAHRLSNNHSNIAIAEAPPALTRVDRKPSIASLGSKLSVGSFAPEKFPSAWKWAPPASWAGPPRATTSVDSDEGSKEIGRPKKLVRVGSAKGSLNRHVHARPGLPSQTIWQPQSSRLTEFGTPDDASVSEEGTVSPDVIIKVQAAETDEWHESDMAHVIPRLRALKCG